MCFIYQYLLKNIQEILENFVQAKQQVKHIHAQKKMVQKLAVPFQKLLICT